MSRDATPIVEQFGVELFDPLCAKYSGSHVAVYIKWPALGVSILHSLHKVKP